MKILFVGSNPSVRSETNTAFHGSTKSARILDEWTKDIVGDKIYHNVSTVKTVYNRPLKVSEIKEGAYMLLLHIMQEKPDKIIALGKTAAKALAFTNQAFLEMPHPSGRNRLLNDTKYVEQKIKELAEFCAPASSSIDLPNSNN